MNRLQIIILSFLAVLLVSVLSGRSEKDFKTDYDLRFICSLNVEIYHTPVNTELKNSNEQNDLSRLFKKTVCSENLHYFLVGGFNPSGKY